MIILVTISFIKIDAQNRPFKRIGLISPSVSKIERILFLINNDIIEIDSLQIIGIFHESQTELSELSEQYVNEYGLDYISFEYITDHISIDSLFIESKWTSQFSKISLKK